jgi:hypothetical protein
VLELPGRAALGDLPLHRLDPEPLDRRARQLHVERRQQLDPARERDGLARRPQRLGHRELRRRRKPLVRRLRRGKLRRGGGERGPEVGRDVDRLHGVAIGEEDLREHLPVRGAVDGGGAARERARQPVTVAGGEVGEVPADAKGFRANLDARAATTRDLPTRDGHGDIVYRGTSGGSI